MDYVRLPGRRHHLYQKTSLWLGSDHVLFVESSWYTESYKRFHFKDIQAVLVRRTSRATTLSVVLTLLAFLAALPIVLGARGPLGALAVPSGLMAALLLLLLLVNLVKGPACVCHILMPLTAHELPSISRTKYAARLLSVLRPKVEALQGVLSPGDVGALAARSIEWAHAAPVSYDPGSPVQRPETSGTVHWLLFATLLAGAGLIPVRHAHNNLPLTLLTGIFGLLVLGFAVMALVRQKGRDIPLAAKILSWAVLPVCWFLLFIDSLYSVFLLIEKNPTVLAGDEWAVLWAISGIDRSADPVFSKLDFVSAAILFVCGVSGLLAMAVRRRFPPPALMPSALQELEGVRQDNPR